MCALFLNQDIDHVYSLKSSSLKGEKYHLENLKTKLEQGFFKTLVAKSTFKFKNLKIFNQQS